MNVFKKITKKIFNSDVYKQIIDLISMNVEKKLFLTKDGTQKFTQHFIFFL